MSIKSRKMVMSALIAVGCGAFAADVGVKVNGTFASGVTPGRNTYAGLADTAMVNGTVPISLLRASAGEFLGGNLAPAEASALKIENGQVKMTVEVDESTDLKVWKPAKKVDLVVPVEGEKGFYILKSK